MFEHNGAFSGFSVDDVEAARRFYGETLGLAVNMNQMGILNITLGNGARVIAYPKSDHQPATYTMLNFLVSDINAAVDALVAAGVSMEMYPPSEYMQQDEKGIAHDPNGPAIAWFKDPAGNVLSVIESSGQDGM
jgi:catechol 2,3-dioxygenase-like lactoylglutathione lyase family enzyme